MGCGASRAGTAAAAEAVPPTQPQQAGALLGALGVTSDGAGSPPASTNGTQPPATGAAAAPSSAVSVQAAATAHPPAALQPTGRQQAPAAAGHASPAGGGGGGGGDDTSTLQDDPLAASKLGITLRGLRRLLGRLQQRFGVEALAAMSTTQVMERYVQEVTRPRRCRLLELAAPGGEVEPSDVAPPVYFISHCWKNLATRMFEYVLVYLQHADDGVAVWIDILAVNQHAGTQAQRHDVSPEAFSATVQACAAGTVVVLDTQVVSPATRAWCIFEWTHTLTLHGPDGLHLHLRPQDRGPLIASIDVESAQCFVPADKEMILAEVTKHHASPQLFNAKLKLQLLLEPLSYRVDVRRLSQQAEDAGTAWDWAAVGAWLVAAAEAGRGTRVLCISGGAGTGKSTVSAVLCARGLAAAGGGGGAGGAAAAGAVLAHHFVKYNDARRQDSVRVIKSLAYQLAESLPLVRDHLLQLDVAAVAGLSDAEEAFRLLLLQPLRAFHEAQEQHEKTQGNSQAPPQVVLLIDALDEADPPELLRAAATAGSGDGGPSGAGGLAAQAPPACPTVCGNSALQLLVAQLSQLPPCVRFVLTTRPDAAAGQVLQCLDRTFGGSSGGGVTHLRPAELRKGGSGGSGRGNSDGVLLYHTAAAALADEAAKAAQAGASSAAAATMPPAHPPQLSTVLDLYGKVFDTARARYRSSSSGAAAASPSSPASADSSTSDVSTLLSVLLAAREPLSASFLQQLGLGSAIPRLPGSGRLFFIDKHHLYTAHRTLDDWLLRRGSSSSAGSGDSGGDADPFAVQLGHGHQAIGLYLANSVWQGGEGADDAKGVGGGGALGAKGATAAADAATAGAGGNGSSGSGGVGTGGGGSAATALPYMLPYTLKYVVSHLVAAVEWQAAAFAAAAAASADRDGIIDITNLDPHVAYGPAAVCLDELLTDFGFLTAALGAGHGPALVGTLAGLSAHTRHSYDVLRWLQAEQFNLLGKSPAAAALHALATAPVGCGLHAEAARSAGLPWAVRRVLPDPGGWAQSQMVLKGHPDKVLGLAYSPDSRQLASVGEDDGAVRVYNTRTGECIAVLQPQQPQQQQQEGEVAQPGGEVAAAGGVAARAHATGHAPGRSVRAVSWSPDGRCLATGGDDCRLLLWDVATGQVTHEFAGGHQGGVYGAAFSPDGAKLASCGGDKVIRVWEVASGAATCVCVLAGHNLAVRCVAWSSDGRQLASAGEDCTARIWHAETGEQMAKVDDFDDDVNCVAWSPDNLALVICSSDGKLLRHDVATGDTETVMELRGGEVKCAAFSRPPAPTPPPTTQQLPQPQPQLLLASGDQAVRLWDGDSFAHRGDLPGGSGRVQVVAFSPDGRQLAAGGASAAAAGETGDSAAAAAAATAEGPGDVVRRLAIPSDGEQVAVGCKDRYVRVWDAGTGVLVAKLPGHDTPVSDVAWNPTRGALLASCAHDGMVLIWDVSALLAESLLLQLSDYPPEHLKWQMEALMTRARPHCAAVLTEHECGVLCVAWSLAGDLLASGGRDGAVRVWEVERDEEREVTARCVAVLTGHAAAVTRLAFSEDGQLLASCCGGGGGGGGGGGAGEDSTVRVWAVRGGGECRAELKGHTGGVHALAFTGGPGSGGSEGRQQLLATGGDDKVVRLWAMDASGGASRCVAQLQLGAAVRAAPSLDDLNARGEFSFLAVNEAMAGQFRGIVYGLDWGVDGSQLVVAANDDKLRLYQRAGGAGAGAGAGAADGGEGGGEGGGAEQQWVCVAELPGHAETALGGVMAVAASLDGKVLASGGCDGTVRVWRPTVDAQEVELDGGAD
ncbi:hypothetical protein HYH02_005293 [Chlamydomonas schloesseri]|uniref:Nephrocystin 3-like N-terminal domain-containing protein n=1 Tax=Chlamydomonas schloesseri TaxID=2026947 RepID=A0A836B7I8_9CHLO|nr:hypothetical protein HYH02_005293 [Chlamydomonas schloesseri]|eukprot:KAG2449768.1 hypothetical protein HYH02_005293 [Chlamydomonas schloesseri]